MLKIAAMLTLMASPALAHTAIQGWAYPTDCCGGRDCFQFEGERIKETPEGYALPSGLVVPYNDRRLRPSPDGEYHVCVNFSSKDLQCLFIPPRAM